MLLVCIASEDITFNDAFEQRLFKSRSQVNRKSEPCPIVAVTPSVMLIMLSMAWRLTRMGSVGLGAEILLETRYETTISEAGTESDVVGRCRLCRHLSQDPRIRRRRHMVCDVNTLGFGVGWGEIL